MGGNFKFEAQDSFLEYFFLKNESHFLKEATFSCSAWNHGLRTPNEDINQRYLKNWAGEADKISFGRT